MRDEKQGDDGEWAGIRKEPAGVEIQSEMAEKREILLHKAAQLPLFALLYYWNSFVHLSCWKETIAVVARRKKVQASLIGYEK